MNYENLKAYTKLREAADRLTGFLEEAFKLDKTRACPKCGKVYLSGFAGTCFCGGSLSKKIRFGNWLKALNRELNVTFMESKGEVYGVRVVADVMKTSDPVYQLILNTHTNTIELVDAGFGEYGLDDTVEFEMPYVLRCAIHRTLKDIGLSEVTAKYPG